MARDFASRRQTTDRQGRLGTDRRRYGNVELTDTARGAPQINFGDVHWAANAIEPNLPVAAYPQTHPERNFRRFQG